jgi:hypothetical protein
MLLGEFFRNGFLREINFKSSFFIAFALRSLIITKRGVFFKVNTKRCI